MSRTLPLHKRCSCTVDIEIWRMRRMLRWRNTSNLSSCDFRSDQVSAPHKSRFIEIAQKRRYLMYMSRWGLLVFKSRPSRFWKVRSIFSHFSLYEKRHFAPVWYHLLLLRMVRLHNNNCFSLNIFYLTKLAREQEATYHAPHTNMVTMAPSPLVQNHVKHDEDMGYIG